MTYPASHPLAAVALSYHQAIDGVGEGEYGCPGITCPGVQRLIAFGERCVDAVTPSAKQRARASQALALTICQPYAHLIATGAKPIENREWETAYRGPLLIHAGKSTSWLSKDEDPGAYVFGAIEAVAALRACLPRSGAPEERDRWTAWWSLYHHEHAHGPWCWVLEDVIRLERPVPCNGQRKLWRPEPAVVEAVAAQVGWDLW